MSANIDLDKIYDNIYLEDLDMIKLRARLTLKFKTLDNWYCLFGELMRMLFPIIPIRSIFRGYGKYYGGNQPNIYMGQFYRMRRRQSAGGNQIARPEHQSGGNQIRRRRALLASGATINLDLVDDM